MQYLTTDSVSLQKTRQIAKAAGLKLWPTTAQPKILNGKTDEMPVGVCVLAGEINNQKLTALLNLPIENILDANALEKSIVQFLKKEKSVKLNQTLGVLLTGPVIYQCDIAQIFTEALRQRLNFSMGRFAGIHMALHEALVNGLTHGNLGLSSELRQTARDFMKYTKLLSARLKDPTFARKSLSIVATWNEQKLEIKIRDEGAGYTVQTDMQQMPSVSAKSGRGLRLIAGTADSCTIDDFGREITLSFLLKETDHYKAAEQIAEEGVKNPTAPDLSKCRVLVVEDEKSNQTLLCRFLNIMGISDIEVAADGIEALYKVAANKPDLIILDLTMPRMNGYEVLHHLKSTEQTQDIPVLIQTASDTRETRDQTFKLGATDFLIKPLNPLEFFSRVKVHLENRLLIKHLKDQLAQIDVELASAQKMQEQLLPTDQMLEVIRQKYHLDIAHFFESSSRLGGDFWQLFPISEEEVGIYICDFSGHGVSAALNTFRLHAIITSMNRRITTPSAFLLELNRRLLLLLPRGQFATFFFGIWNVKKKILKYAAAGSPNPILKSGRKKTFLDTAGMPLGIASHPEYTDYQVPFKKGDSILLFSDALTESPNAEGERLGEDGFAKQVLKAFSAKTAKKAIDGIMARFFEFTKPPLPDDATAVFIRSEK